MNTYTEGSLPSQDLEEVSRVRDLAFEMLDTLEIITSHTYVMETEFSSLLRARIRRVVKAARGE